MNLQAFPANILIVLKWHHFFKNVSVNESYMPKT